MTKDKRIKKELDRLNEIYKDLPEDTYAVLQPLIENAAFMAVTLQDLQEQIKRDGPIEEYRNGNTQYGKKQASALMAYNNTLRNYNNTIKVLSSKMPVVTVKKELTYWPPKQTQEEEETKEARNERLHREFIESIRQQE